MKRMLAGTFIVMPLYLDDSYAMKFYRSNLRSICATSELVMRSDLLNCGSRV